jgi:DNA-directed RNA polymerase subunit H
MERILLNITKMLTARKILKEEKLDINYKSLVKQINEERVFKIKSDYDDTKFFNILFVYGKLTTIKKIQGLETFLQKSKGQNRIFIADNINQKAYKQFKELNNTEIFFEYELQLNLIEHDLQPIFQVLTDEEKEKFMEEYQVTKKQMSKMKSIDPIARYFNSKAGDIFRIIRPSTSAGVGIHYRIVIDSNVSEIFEKK